MSSNSEVGGAIIRVLRNEAAHMQPGAIREFLLVLTTHRQADNAAAILGDFAAEMSQKYRVDCGMATKVHGSLQEVIVPSSYPKFVESEVTQGAARYWVRVTRKS